MNNCFQNPDMADVKALLHENKLPIDDLLNLNMEHFFAFGDEKNVKGVIGLEVYGTDGLLRSLAVCSAERGAGCGTLLVEKLESYARSVGVKSLYLLTETAEEFFVQKGYTSISREMASSAIRETRQFSDLCPASAALMRKVISS